MLSIKSLTIEVIVKGFNPGRGVLPYMASIGQCATPKVWFLSRVA